MKICKVEGCENKHIARGYCNKHYIQRKRHNKIFKRTRFDKNEIILKNDYAEVVLYDNKRKEIARTLIDLEDVEKIKSYKWHLNDSGYTTCNVKGKNIRLHRLIMKVSDDKEIDHIYHDLLDNRKSQLRICTNSQNSMNRKVKGYSWEKGRQKWQTYIEINGKRIFLGYFKIKSEAKEARKQAEIKYYKEFRYIL